MSAGWRAALTRIAPTFLQGPWAQKFLYTPGLILDLIQTWMIEGVTARFPSVGTPTAFPHIARDRGVVLGFEEPIDSQQARLVRAIDSKRRVGHPRVLLRQLEGYLTNYAVQIAIVSSRGTWHVLKDGEITTSKLVGNWNWQGETVEEWARFWVIIWPLDSEIWEDEGEWGEDEDEWGDGGTWGTTATPAQVESIREIVTSWKPAGRRGVWTIIALDPNTFPPAGAPGTDGLPTGNFQFWGKDDGLGVIREVREPSARYWDGTTRSSAEIDL